MRLKQLGTIAVAATAALGLAATLAVAFDPGPGAAPGRRPAAAPRRAPADDAKEVAAELKALEGTWRVVKLEDDGKEVPAEGIAKVRFTFKGDELEQTEIGSKRTEKLKVSLSLGPNPKHLTLTPRNGDPEDKVIPAIYKRDGDTLTICGPSTEQKDLKRPKEFKSVDGVVLLTLERVKDEKDELAALAGKWKVTALNNSGNKAPANEIATMSWTINTTGEVVADDGDGSPPGKMTLKVTPAEAPAHVSMTPTEGPEKGNTCEGIYFRQADKLFFAFADDKKKADRPKELKPGDGVVYITFERVSDK
jgi:uncharacterized protein (TIGR03067 family)